MKKFIAFLFFITGPYCWALDTTETFSKGFSDIELHSELAPKETSVTGVLGYGVSNWFNPSLGLTRLQQESSDVSTTTLEIGNFAHVYEGFFDIDLLAGTILPDDESSQYLGTEISRMSGRFMPFIKGLCELAQGEVSNSGALGLSFQGDKDTELFTQSTWDLSNGLHTQLAIGLNYQSPLGMELISEVGQRPQEDDVYASLGAIWTLE